MSIRGVYLNSDGGYLDGSVARFEERLSYAKSCGFDGLEVSIPGLDLVVGGRVNWSQVERVRAVIERYGLPVTAHAPERTNLAFPQRIPGCEPELALEMDVFRACLEVCGALGTAVMVYHSGLIALHEARIGLQPLPDAATLARAAAQEVTALRELMPLAEAQGVVVGMENRDPHPWEVAALARCGVAHTELLRYHAGMSVPALVGQVSAVDHPYLGLTLDLGHLYLAARYCGFDYLGAIREAAPHVRHVHGSDNEGRLGGVFDDLGSRVPYGDGDVHLPPGWGSLPHADALSALAGYDGLYVMEVRPRFRDHLPEALAFIREVIGQVAGA
ncbi:MAG: sugar phosphate isomerase/epimerase [Anaerolineae bacterium]|nr:sugar phosphate isomerase/epimerase [Anaerolineae bacterium]